MGTMGTMICLFFSLLLLSFFIHFFNVLLHIPFVLHRTYSSASDVWAFGITLWEIITLGKEPYGGGEGKK